MKPRYKPVERPEWEDTWFCYIVPKRGRGHPSALNKAVSQVPDLNRGKKGLPELEPPKASKNKPGPNDTKYIRLAKAGGRKNLLEFKECTAKKEEPVEYPVTEWYYDTFEEVENDDKSGKTERKTDRYYRPDWMTHIEHDPSAHKDSTRQLRRPIIGFDALSTWKRNELEEKLDYKSSTRETKLKIDSKSKERMDRGYVKGREKKEKGRIRLPKLVEPRTKRKLSGADLAVRWYDKWYVAAVK